MNENGHHRRHFEFADFRLYPHERLLIKNDGRVALTPRVLDLLILLVEREGELVGKETLLDVVWADSFVDEGNISRAVSTLRKNLGVQGNGSDFIETVPKLGYRFIAPVHQVTEDPKRAVSPEKLAPHGRPILLAVAALSVMALVGFGSYFWRGGSSSHQTALGAIRLTDDPANDFWPKWTSDGRIRFFRKGTAKSGQNMVMSADGTDQTVLAPEFQSYLHWSPDGTKYLFGKPGDNTTTFLANADGSNEIALPLLGNTDWASDSRKFVYQSRSVKDGNSELFIYSIDTGKSQNITNHPSFDADPSFSQDGQRVVFISSRDGNSEVYSMNADGSDVRRLTNHLAGEDHPVFSPDGTQIAFNSDRENENSDVYLMNVDGSNVRHLTEWKSNESVEPGCWSPDGTKVAFISDRDGNNNIFVVSAEVDKPELVLADSNAGLQNPSYSADGKQVAFQAEIEGRSGELRILDLETKRTRTLLKTENADLQPKFSPQKDEILFQNKIGSNTEVCLIKADGTGLTNLTNDPARDGNPAFSSDGKQIVFTSNRDGSYGASNIFVMNVDGSSQRQVFATHLGVSVSPVWSPDGASILFANDKEGGRSGNFEIYKLGLGPEGIEQRLTFRRRYDWQPTVSPDGQRIAFASDMDGNLEIYVMNYDGGGLLRLTRDPSSDTSPRFSPDGKKIIFGSNRNGRFALYEIKLDG